MLEMVLYIPRFTITIKRGILSAARESGERCKLPQRGLGGAPAENKSDAF